MHYKSISPRLAQLEIHKEELAFSAGHFTIFSATEREHLHGHNYAVSCAFTLYIKENGLSFDYRHYKNKLHSLCNKLDRHFLLPQFSEYLELHIEKEYYIAIFNNQKIPFLKEDVVLLPLTNITIEELAHWFLQQLLLETKEITEHAISSIQIKVYNGPGQSGGALWERLESPME